MGHGLANTGEASKAFSSSQYLGHRGVRLLPEKLHLRAGRHPPNRDFWPSSSMTEALNADNSIAKTLTSIVNGVHVRHLIRIAL